jgi:hypothetical protein
MRNRMEESRRKGGQPSQDTVREIVVPGERGGYSSSGTGWASVLGEIAGALTPPPRFLLFLGKVEGIVLIQHG